MDLQFMLPNIILTAMSIISDIRHYVTHIISGYRKEILTWNRSTKFVVKHMVAITLNINPFHATDLFLYPEKISENLWFSDIFWGYRKRSLTWNGSVKKVNMSIKTEICCYWHCLRIYNYIISSNLRLLSYPRNNLYFE